MSQGQLLQFSSLVLALGTSKKKSQTQQIWNTDFGIDSGLGMLKFIELMRKN